MKPIKFPNLVIYKGKSGIYKILCKSNKKYYIGSAHCVYNRLLNHFIKLRNNCHDNDHLQAAYNKYREEAFECSVVEYCNKEECFKREQYYLDTLQPWNSDIGFNIRRKVEGGGYPGKSITLQNLKTKEIKTWENRKIAAFEIGCAPCSVTTLSKGNCKSINSWGLPGTEKYGTGSNNKLKPVTLKNIHTGEIKTWKSRKEFYDQEGGDGGAYALISMRIKCFNNKWCLPETEKNDIYQNPITLQNLTTKEIKTWNSKMDFAREIKCSSTSVSYVLSKKTKSIKGWGLVGTEKWGHSNNGKRDIITLQNTKTGEIKTWKSHKEAWHEIGASISDVSRRVVIAAKGWVLPENYEKIKIKIVNIKTGEEKTYFKVRGYMSQIHKDLKLTMRYIRKILKNKTIQNWKLCQANQKPKAIAQN